jgi:hypothetical protein
MVETRPWSTVYLETKMYRGVTGENMHMAVPRGVGNGYKQVFCGIMRNEHA